MSDDWQPGDLALCVNNSDFGGSGKGGGLLRLGAIYTVEQVIPPAVWIGGWYGCGLILSGVVNIGNPDFSARRFRKIRPHTPDAEDAETIRLLTGTPVREPVA